MIELDTEPRILGFLLGLGDLNRTVCHGFGCCCQCVDCVERETAPPPAEPVRQPWELAA